MLTVYGIPNCDSTQKALKWLTKNRINYRFHDYKTEGITRDILNNWCKQTSWEQILNKRSTTWRVLTVQDQGKITHEKAAIELMITANSLIKRPIIEKDTQLLAIGFDEKQLNRLL